MLAEKNISQTALAKRLGRAQSYVSERDTGKRFWTTADLDVIAATLETTPLNLLTEIVRRIKAQDAAQRENRLGEGGVEETINSRRPAAKRRPLEPDKPRLRRRQG